MFTVIKGAQDFQALQNDIDKLLVWANNWQLRFNVFKCYVLHLGPPHGCGEYSMQGTIISSNDTIKDLGIHIDSNLKFYFRAGLSIPEALGKLSIGGPLPT